MGLYQGVNRHHVQGGIVPEHEQVFYDVKTGQLVKGGIVPESVQVFGNNVKTCKGWDTTRICTGITLFRGWEKISGLDHTSSVFLAYL